MIDENIARLRTYRNNISRYRRLLKTTLTDLEREFLERRLAEEQLAFEALVSGSFPSRSILNIQLLQKPPLDQRNRNSPPACTGGPDVTLCVEID